MSLNSGTGWRISNLWSPWNKPDITESDVLSALREEKDNIISNYENKLSTKEYKKLENLLNERFNANKVCKELTDILKDMITKKMAKNKKMNYESIISNVESNLDPLIRAGAYIDLIDRINKNNQNKKEFTEEEFIKWQNNALNKDDSHSSYAGYSLERVTSLMFLMLNRKIKSISNIAVDDLMTQFLLINSGAKRTGYTTYIKLLKEMNKDGLTKTKNNNYKVDKNSNLQYNDTYNTINVYSSSFGKTDASVFLRLNAFGFQKLINATLKNYKNYGNVQVLGNANYLAAITQWESEDAMNKFLRSLRGINEKGVTYQTIADRSGSIKSTVKKMLVLQSILGSKLKEGEKISNTMIIYELQGGIPKFHAIDLGKLKDTILTSDDVYSFNDVDLFPALHYDANNQVEDIITLAGIKLTIHIKNLTNYLIQ